MPRRQQDLRQRASSRAGGRACRSCSGPSAATRGTSTCTGSTTSANRPMRLDVRRLGPAARPHQVDQDEQRQPGTEADEDADQHPPVQVAVPGGPILRQVLLHAATRLRSLNTARLPRQFGRKVTGLPASSSATNSITSGPTSLARSLKSLMVAQRTLGVSYHCVRQALRHRHAAAQQRQPVRPVGEVRERRRWPRAPTRSDVAQHASTCCIICSARQAQHGVERVVGEHGEPRLQVLLDHVDAALRCRPASCRRRSRCRSRRSACALCR